MERNITEIRKICCIYMKINFIVKIIIFDFKKGQTHIFYKIFKYQIFLKIRVFLRVSIHKYTNQNIFFVPKIK